MHCRLGRHLLPLSLLLLPLATVAQTVVGVVHAVSPLDGVMVQAELDGHPLPALNTGADGHFSLVLNAANAGSDLRLSFGKSGFRPQTRLFSVATATAKALDIALEPLTGQGAISDNERTLWEPHRTAGGNGPLMFVPYSLSANTAVQAAELNSRLQFQLQRLIVTRLQSIFKDDEEAQVALKPVGFTMASDVERLRTFGEYVNALGVVSGQGIGDTGPAGATIEFSSIFLIIPHSSQFEPPGLWINDAPVPAASVGRASLDPKLSKDWGRAVIIALATRDLKNVETLPQPERAGALRKIRRYLIAARADVGGNEGQSAAALQQLIGLVNKAVTP